MPIVVSTLDMTWFVNRNRIAAGSSECLMSWLMAAAVATLSLGVAFMMLCIASLNPSISVAAVAEGALLLAIAGGMARLPLCLSGSSPTRGRGGV